MQVRRPRPWLAPFSLSSLGEDHPLSLVLRCGEPSSRCLPHRWPVHSGSSPGWLSAHQGVVLPPGALGVEAKGLQDANPTTLLLVTQRAPARFGSLGPESGRATASAGGQHGKTLVGDLRSCRETREAIQVYARKSCRTGSATSCFGSRGPGLRDRCSPAGLRTLCSGSRAGRRRSGEEAGNRAAHRPVLGLEGEASPAQPGASPLRTQAGATTGAEAQGLPPALMAGQAAQGGEEDWRGSHSGALPFPGDPGDCCLGRSGRCNWKTVARASLGSADLLLDGHGKPEMRETVGRGLAPAGTPQGTGHLDCQHRVRVNSSSSGRWHEPETRFSGTGSLVSSIYSDRRREGKVKQVSQTFLFGDNSGGGFGDPDDPEEKFLKRACYLCESQTQRGCG